METLRLGTFFWLHLADTYLVSQPIVVVGTLDATGYRTTAVYNPKSDTSAVFRNVGTGICSVLGHIMGQRGETHTRFAGPSRLPGYPIAGNVATN